MTFETGPDENLGENVLSGRDANVEVLERQRFSVFGERKGGRSCWSRLQGRHEMVRWRGGSLRHQGPWEGLDSSLSVMIKTEGLEQETDLVEKVFRAWGEE